MRYLTSYEFWAGFNGMLAIFMFLLWLSAYGRAKFWQDETKRSDNAGNAIFKKLCEQSACRLDAETAKRHAEAEADRMTAERDALARTVTKANLWAAHERAREALAITRQDIEAAGGEVEPMPNGEFSYHGRQTDTCFPLDVTVLGCQLYYVPLPDTPAHRVATEGERVKALITRLIEHPA